MQYPASRRESPASKALRSLTPLLRCHHPIDSADQQLLLRAVDEPVTCHGLPSAGLWFGSGGDVSSAVAFVTLAAVLLSAFVLNALVLWLLHVGRIRLTDIGVIGICANAISDLALVINYLVNDYLVPLLPSSAQLADPAAAPLSIVEALSHALLCRFRMYIGQSCLSMNILVVASLAKFAGRKAYERLIGSAPCGIFMFPSLLAFLALGANIWFLVLCECRMLAFGYGRRLTVSLPVLLTDSPTVGWALLGLSAGTQLLPLILACYFLWRNWRPQPTDPRTLRLLRLTGWLCAAHTLCLPQTILLTAYFAQPPASQRGSLPLLLLGLCSAACTAAMLVVKPVLYLTLQPDIRAAFLARVLRRGGVGGDGPGGDSVRRLRQQDSIMSSFVAPGPAEAEAAETADTAEPEAVAIVCVPADVAASAAQAGTETDGVDPEESRQLLLSSSASASRRRGVDAEVQEPPTLPG